ncbi:MAG TPA: L,D-transpeptidase family protein [Rhodocyclaceae bacterium]|nr:L,D-transpeptidase family protein [Rhodocyclaceae bacterium]
MRRAVLIFAAVGVSAVLAMAMLHEPTRSAIGFLKAKWHGPYTVDDRLEQFGARVAERLRPSFAGAGLTYPPHEVTYVAFKDERVLELYARNSASDAWRFVKKYAVQGASGRLGPKLVEGDYQVPEGIYKAEFLNPNSRFHVSIRLNYPNQFDRNVAKIDNRVNLGGDIMIHGSSASVGCLAMGDEAAEELFALSALVAKERTRIVVSPTDFRSHGAVGPEAKHSWVPVLYEDIRRELTQYRRESNPSIEQTPSSMLRMPTVAAHVQR